MSKVALLGLGKYQKEQSHEIWWTYPWPHGNSRWIYGRGGHNGPPPGKIGLINNNFLALEEENGYTAKISTVKITGIHCVRFLTVVSMHF